MKFGSLLVVTYGRSGSTLLQGLLNGIEGCVIRGENNNFCHGLFQSWTALEQARAAHTVESADVTKPWYGIAAADSERFLRDAASLVRGQLLGDLAPESVRCYGFKEIRYVGARDLPRYLDFLEQIFPDPAFVMLTRDHAEVANSAWWRSRDPREVSADLRNFEDATRAWASKRGNVFRLDYAELVANGEKLEGLFDFLGAPYDRETIRAVLAQPHSYQPKGAAAAGAKKAGVETEPAPTEAVGGKRVGQGAGFGLRQFAFDAVPRAGGLGGLAVLEDDALRGASLKAVCLGRDVPLQWPLPSPVAAQRFPGVAGAANARFLVETRGLPAGARLEVFLLCADGRRILLGSNTVPVSRPESTR